MPSTDDHVPPDAYDSLEEAEAAIREHQRLLALPTSSPPDDDPDSGDLSADK